MEEISNCRQRLETCLLKLETTPDVAFTLQNVSYLGKSPVLLLATTHLKKYIKSLYHIIYFFLFSCIVLLLNVLVLITIPEIGKIAKKD